MNDFPCFDYRLRPDLIIEVICAVCHQTIAMTDDEFYLRDIENGHKCMEVPHLRNAS